MIHLIPGPHPTSRDISKALIKSNMQPKKWAISRNEENHKEVNHYANIGGSGVVYSSNWGWIHSEPVDSSSTPLVCSVKHPSFTEITIEQFREITNPTKSNTMNKAELIEAIKVKLNQSIAKSKTHTGTDYENRANAFGEALELLKQLPDDGEITQGKGEPELIPFKWPVPDGFEVVTRDGREVKKLTDFTGTDNEYAFYGLVDTDIVSWTVLGIEWLGDESPKDLFLRPTPPEMVTMWINWYGDKGYSFSSKEEADVKSTYDRIGPAIKIQFPKPKQF